MRYDSSPPIDRREATTSTSNGIDPLPPPVLDGETLEAYYYFKEKVMLCLNYLLFTVLKKIIDVYIR